MANDFGGGSSHDVRAGYRVRARRRGTSLAFTGHSPLGREHYRPYPARGGGSGTGFPWAHQPPDRLGTLHLRAHGRHPHYQEPQEARPELPLPALRLGGRTRVVPIGQEQLASLSALTFQQTRSRQAEVLTG